MMTEAAAIHGQRGRLFVAAADLNEYIEQHLRHSTSEADALADKRRAAHPRRRRVAQPLAAQKRGPVPSIGGDRGRPEATFVSVHNISMITPP